MMELLKIKMFIYNDNEQIKKEIKKTLTDNNITAKELCDKLGMLPQTYQSMLNKKNFSFADMKKILDILNCEMRIDIVKKE